MKKTAIVLALILSLSILGGCASPAAGSSMAPSSTASSESPSSAGIKDDVKLEELHTAVKEAYGENYIPSMAFEEEQITQTMGVSKDLYDEALVEGPMISTHVDVFAAFKAKEGKAEDVEKALNAYREKLVSDTMQYPMNVPKIQSSRVVKYGNYVFFLMLGAFDDTITDEKAQLEAAGKQIDIGEDAIKKVLGA